MNGLLVVDKAGGMTSHDVVAKLRGITGEPSLGHLGTLDPMATGVLPILAGKYTRLAQFFGPLVKTYTGSIRFGFATDTYDAEGSPASAAKDVSLTLEAVRAAAEGFRGEIDQIPPPFSAKKV
ncbi:MAG TPA: tRNA pseudouridine(55) synthase, partial [Acidobacteriaceae bacterium]|nr:tRNA pseudouridine(55) synthase [Acidobacteriaceae bacterium]